jgi:nucleoside-diphosphate-sugar epimerase
VSIVAITGATGFLGSALARRLASAGHEVRGLSRDPDAAPAQSGVTWFRCRLPHEVDPAGLRGADVLVHCAYDTRFTRAARARAVNVDGSALLLRERERAGVRKVVFISSLSAHADARSVYGRTKLEVESLLGEHDAALRPGLIIGEGGVFFRTARSIARIPFIPLFYGGEQRVQTVAIDDVCTAVEAIIAKDLAGVISVAEREPVRLRDFYGAVARALGKRPRFVVLPGGLTLLGLRAAERLGFRLPISSDNLLGLERLRAFDLDQDIERLGFEPRSMQESLKWIRWTELARRP